MKKVFVRTENYHEFDAIAEELASEQSKIGSSMAVVTGKAGRGKTEASKFYAINSQAIYIRTLPVFSPRMLLQEIAYELTGAKPFGTAQCLEIIGDEMKKYRRLVIIDEADLLEMRVIETLRGINERCDMPIMLVGEEALKQKLATRARIISRIRRRLNFTPIKQRDITEYYRDALGIELSTEAANYLFKKAGGDWRPAVNMAVTVDLAMKASGVENKSMGLAEIEGLFENEKA